VALIKIHNGFNTFTKLRLPLVDQSSILSVKDEVKLNRFLDT